MRRLVPASRAIVSTAGRLIACGSSSFPGGLERQLFILSRAGMFLTMRVSFVLAWGIAFSFLARAHVISPVVASLAFPSSASLGGGYVLGACPRPHHPRHHLVRRGRSFLLSSCSALSYRCPLFSSGAAIVRRTAGVASHQSLRLVLIELGKTAQNMISCSSPSDTSSGFSFLVSPCRLVERLVPYLSS